MSEIKQKIVRATVFDVSGNAISTALLFVASIIIARYLGPELLGQYAIIFAFIGALNVLVTFGTTQALVRYLGELSGAGAPDMEKTLLRDVVLVKIAALCLSFLVVALLRDFIFSLFGLVFDAWLFIFLVVYVASLGISSIMTTYLQTRFQQKYFRVVEIVGAVLTLLGITYFVLANIVNVPNLLMLSLGLLILKVIFYYARYRKLTRMPAAAIQAAATQRLASLRSRFFRYSGFMFLITLGGAVLAYRSDTYFISFYIGLVAVGYYSLASDLVDNLYKMILPQSFTTMYTSAMVADYTRRGSRVISGYFKKLVEYSFFFIFPAAIGGSILSQEIILAIYGSEYLPAAQLLMLFFLIVSLFKFAGAIASVLVTLEKPHYFMWTKLFSIMNIILNILLIPVLGVFGALYSTAITQSAIIVSEYWLARRLVPIRMPWPAMTKMFILSALMGAIVIFLKYLLTDFSVYLRLAIPVIVGASTYISLAFLLGIIDKDYLSTIIRLKKGLNE